MPATAGRPAMNKSAKIMAPFIVITSLLSPCANATLGGSFPGPNLRGSEIEKVTVVVAFGRSAITKSRACRDRCDECREVERYGCRATHISRVVRRPRLRVSAFQPSGLYAGGSDANWLPSEQGALPLRSQARGRHQSPIAAHRFLRTHQLLQNENDGCRRCPSS